MPDDKKRLTVQAEPYLWYITGSYGAGQGTSSLKPLSDDSPYFLNVADFNKADGTPIIVYTSKTGKPVVNGSSNYGTEDNERFLFKAAK